jgi:hypothetical protein
MVRDLGFDPAMAIQTYTNLMRDQQAKLAAERGGLPPETSIEREQRLSLKPRINPETIKKARDEYYASQPKNRAYSAMMTKTKYGGEFGSSIGSGFDKWFETNYINNPNSSLTAQERASIIPESRITADEAGRMQGPQRDPNTGMTFQEMMARQNQPFPPEQATFTPAPQFPQEARDAINSALGQYRTGRLMGAPTEQQPGYGIDYIEGGQRYMPMTPTPSQMAQFQQGQQGAMASQYQNLQGQQMQNYNNLLQQGIQRSNTMNQDAAAGFANLQPGMQPAQPATANPAMPIAGLGMQQPRKAPAPRKFSTVNTPSARFG